MQIEINTSSFNHAEAKGLVAMMVALYGSTVLPDTVAPSSALSVEFEDDHMIGKAVEQMIAQEQTEAYNVIPAAPVEDWTPPAPMTGSDVDGAGTPYDARIHSGGKTLMKDGTWTKKRGVSDEVYASVMAEITSVSEEVVAAFTSATEAFAAPPVPVAPVAPAVPVAPVAPPVPVAPVAPPVPAAPVAPVAPTAPGAHSFLTVMTMVTKLQGAGSLPKEKVQASLAAVGLESLAALSKASPDQLSAFVALLES